MCKSAPKAPTAAAGYPRRRLGCGACRRERLLGELRSFDHVAELLVGHLPAARSQPAIGTNVDSLRIAEDLRGVENPGAHELTRLDEVRMDVEDAEAEDRLGRQEAEGGDPPVAGAVGPRRSGPAAVARARHPRG